jgi:hypothetical protein
MAGYAATAILKTFIIFNMERNQLITVENLQPGDRFYKQNDKHKKVLVLIEHKPRQVQLPIYKSWCLPASIADKQLKPEVIERYAMAIKKETPIIFLRHSKTPAV